LVIGASKDGDTFAAGVVATIDGWQTEINYRALHSAMAHVPYVRAIGVELSGEEAKGLESIWIGETSNGKVIVTSLREESVVLAESSNAKLEAPWVIANHLCPKTNTTDVYIARNALHATTYSLVVFSDGVERVRLYYDLPRDQVGKWTELLTLLRHVDREVRKSAFEHAE
jgi:hypothetical protein